MKKFTSIVFILVSFVLIGNQKVFAATQQWEFDPVHSGFHFSIDHIYSETRGYFQEFSGPFHFDPDALESSKIDFTIKVKSINTNNGKRDTHLRSDDFFDAGKFPVITFKSSKVMHLKGNQYLIDGTLTIKDVTKKITLQMIYFGQKEHPLNPKQIVAGFESRLTLNRLEYHVGTGKYYQMGVIGKDVDILISLEMLRNK